MNQKQRKRAEVIKRLVSAGWSPPTPTNNITDKILEGIEKTVNSRPSRTLILSENELLVLTLAAQGLTYNEIAKVRGVTLNTVKTQLGIIREKLGAKNLVHAVAIASDQNLIILPEE